MAYRVIKDFLDLEDKNHRYAVGDEYPRSGHAPTEERIKFLLSGLNLLHTPVIMEVTEPDAGEQGMVEEETQDAAEGAKKAVKAVSDDETKEYKPKRTRRSKTAKNTAEEH